MFDLYYNIDFEVIAFLFSILLYIETRLCYPKQTRKNQIFRLLTLMVIITEAFDILSAFTNTYSARLPNLINVTVNSGYFMSGLFLCFMLQYYVEKAFVPSGGRSVLLRANKVVLAVLELSIVINGFFGYYFSFSAEGAYVHGPLFLVMHAASLWFVLCASAALLVNRRLLKRSQIISGVLFVLVYFAAVVLQTLVFPNVLLIMPAASAMLIITIFSMETPDYAQLQQALHELTETKLKLEAANKKYYNLAYTDLMTGLQNRTAYLLELERLEAAKTNDPIIFLIADINDLKCLNDNFGHLVGDDAIKKAAGLLEGAFGDLCRCYRIGGDEFAVIAENVSEADFAERFRRFNSEAQAESSRCAYPFSVAAGYQAAGSLTLLDASKWADEKMYRDKVLGKQNPKPEGER